MTRIGILGTGGMAEYQIKKFKAIPGVEIGACLDADIGKARQFGIQHGIVGVYDDLAAMLEAESLDGVSCCLVDSMHYESCRHIFGKGTGVFCEKPLAQTLARAEEMTSWAAASNKTAMVNLSKRNAPALHALKTSISEGRFGEIRSVSARYHQGWVRTKLWGDWLESPRWRWRLQPAFCTAGVAGDLGVHVMDALIFLFGAPRDTKLGEAIDLNTAMDAGVVPKVPLPVDFGLPRNAAEFAGRAVSDAAGGATTSDDQSRFPAYVTLTGRLRFGRDSSSAQSAADPQLITCDMSISWTDQSATDSFRIEVQGTKSSVVLDLERSRSAVFVHDGGEETQVEGPAVKQSYELFIDALRYGQSYKPDFSDALAAQRPLEELLIQAARK